MKPINAFLIFAVLVAVPTVASAQGYYGPGYGPPPPSGYGYIHDRWHHRRAGRIAWGIGGGIGAMSDGGGRITCAECDYNPLAGELDAHVGAMLSYRFALLFEVQGNFQTYSPNGGDTQSIGQTAAMVAGQYWLLPQLWIKGGIGFAHLEFDYADGGPPDSLDNGTAFMGAIGYEVLSAPHFALDLQARLLEGLYDGNDHITAFNVGLGLSWY